MSLIIYTNFEDVRDKENFIYDVSLGIGAKGIEDCEFSRKVLQVLEKASYVSKNYCISRFGLKLYYSMISMSSRILIAVNQFKDKIINFSECGINCGSLLLELSEGAVYIPRSNITGFNWGAYRGSSIDVLCDGVKYTTLEDFWDFIEKVKEELELIDEEGV